MKILMIGLGGVGQRHLRNLRALLGDELQPLAYRTRRLPTVLTDRLQVESGSELESKYGLVTFTDLDEALAQRPDAAFICNPSSLHVPAALKAARAGCHLFLEKPVSHSLEGLDELQREVSQRGLVATVGYQLRFHPALLRLKTLLEQGALGRVLAVRVQVGEYLPGWHPYEDYRQMYAARRDLGGGVILSQIHELDYLYWLFGLPRRVFAVGGQLSSLDVDVEDVASLLLAFEAEGRPLPVSLHQDYVQRPPARTCEVIGDAGKAVIDFHALAVCAWGSKGEVLEETYFPDFQRNQLFLDELRHFLDCVAGRARPLVSLQDGIHSLRMALAAKESLASGQVVNL